MVGLNWLDEAIGSFDGAFPEKDGLVVFNDGKWKGKIACHGLIHKNTLKYTGGRLFYPGYNHYNCDLELTHVLQSHNKVAYAYNSVVYHLQAKIGRSMMDLSAIKAQKTRKKDDKLFNERKLKGFPF